MHLLPQHGERGSRDGNSCGEELRSTAQQGNLSSSCLEEGDTYQHLFLTSSQQVIITTDNVDVGTVDNQENVEPDNRKETAR